MSINWGQQRRVKAADWDFSVPGEFHLGGPFRTEESAIVAYQERYGRRPDSLFVQKLDAEGNVLDSYSIKVMPDGIQCY